MNESPLSTNNASMPYLRSLRFGPVIRQSTARAFSRWKRETEWYGTVPAAEDLITSLVGNAWSIMAEREIKVGGRQRGKPSDAERVVLALKRSASPGGGFTLRDGVFSVRLTNWTYLVRKSPDGFGVKPQGGSQWVGPADWETFVARLIDFDRMLPELFAKIPGLQHDLEDFRLESSRKKLARMIMQTTAEQLVRKYLAPQGISADCFVDEDGSTVHLQLRKVYTGSLAVPAEGLAEALQDADGIRTALSLEMPREEENEHIVSDIIL